MSHPFSSLFVPTKSEWRFLWINGDDIETLEKYGIPPDEVNNDYALVNETEEWVTYTVTVSTEFSVEYSTEHNELMRREIGIDEFFDYCMKDSTILANVTVSEAGEVIRLDEVYVP